MNPDMSQNSRTDHWSISNKPLLQRFSEHQYAPVILTALMLLLLFLSTAFIAYQTRRPEQAAKTEVSMENKPNPTATLQNNEQVNTDSWNTYINEKHGYSFKYPADNNFATMSKFTPDLIEIFGLDNLIIRIEPVNTTVINPVDWWGQQDFESYTNLPQKCFEIQTSRSVKSLYNSDEIVLNLNQEIYIANNFYTEEDDCIGEYVQFVLIPNDEGLIKITYDWGLLSEQILSTFKFIESSNSLVEINYEGGLCIEGTCQTNYQILNDGSVLMNDEKVATLERSQLEELQQIISGANFEEIKATPFTETCPIAYDGQEVTYTFYLEDREELIPSCTYDIDESHPLFSQLNQIVDSLN